MADSQDNQAIGEEVLSDIFLNWALACSREQHVAPEDVEFDKEILGPVIKAYFPGLPITDQGLDTLVEATIREIVKRGWISC